MYSLLCVSKKTKLICSSLRLRLVQEMCSEVERFFAASGSLPLGSAFASSEQEGFGPSATLEVRVGRSSLSFLPPHGSGRSIAVPRTARCTPRKTHHKLLARYTVEFRVLQRSSKLACTTRLAKQTTEEERDLSGKTSVMYWGCGMQGKKGHLLREDFVDLRASVLLITGMSELFRTAFLPRHCPFAC